MNYLGEKIVKGILIGAICVSVIGCGFAKPQEEVKEAFEKHEITDLVKSYNKSDKEKQNEYKVSFSQYFKDEIIATIDADVNDKYRIAGLQRWEKLNKVAKFAAEVKDDDYSFEKKLAAEVEECYDMRKNYESARRELHDKYKVDEYDNIFTIRRYLVNELKNAPGVFYACGYQSFFGNEFPDNDIDECIVEFGNNFTTIRRGVNRLNVVRAGSERISMEGGFKTEVEKFRAVPSEALYIQSDLEVMRSRIYPKYVNIKDSLKTGHASESSAVPVVGAVGVIMGDDVNIRKGPSTDYESIGAFFKGDRVTIVGSNSDGSHVWYKVEYQNPQYGLISGYVRSDFISVQWNISGWYL